MSTQRTAAIAGLFVTSCMISILFAEIAIRFYAIGWSAFSYEETRSVVRLGDAGIARASPHPDVGYELKPNLETLFKLSTLRTNADGLSDHHYPLTKPSNSFRVAVIGDSQAMASGVQIEDTFHSVLEARFNQAATGGSLNYEFINFSVGGYHPGHYRAVLEHRALAYSPDLILVCITPDNDHDFEWPMRARTFNKRPRRNGFLTSFLATEVDAVMRARNQGNSGNVRSALTDIQKVRLTIVFSDMKRRAESKGVRLGVVYLSRVAGDRTADMRAIIEGLGLVFMDTTTAFRDIPLSETRIYRSDGHPNPFAHRVFADAIESPLRQLIEDARRAGP